MAEKLSDPDAGEDIAVGPDREATTGTSGWQKGSSDFLSGIRCQEANEQRELGDGRNRAQQ